MTFLQDSADREEFVAYFGARLDVIRRTAYLLCGDWHTAEDLAQNALVRLAASWHRMRDPTAVDAYVRTCLIRAYLADAKRAWRRRERTMWDPPENPHPSQEEAVARKVAVRDALRVLPPRQRAVLVCRFYWDLDCEQTGRLLGCSVGTVKSQTSRALATLRAVVGEWTKELTL